MFFVLVLILLLSYLSQGDNLDPVNNYCKRIDHQSTLKNGKIYIDGGIQVFVDQNTFAYTTGPIFYGYNEYLLAIDMTLTWDWITSLPINEIPKPSSDQTDSAIPVVGRAGLFAGAPDDNKIYLYGGTNSNVNASFPNAPPPRPLDYPLWSYDTITGNWQQYQRDTMSSDAQNIPNAGAWDGAPDQGLGFYFSGQIDGGSTSNTQTLGSRSFPIEGMVVIDTLNHTARNLSTESVPPGPLRTRGSMAYLPNIGPYGFLILLGGTNQSMQNSSDETTGTLYSMETVDIFDIGSIYGASSSSEGWYNQSTTGVIPEPRMDFCIIPVSAADNSSHQVYLYGGRNNTHTFDDVYVLSLPSFTWTMLFHGTNPRAFHTCHLVGKSQMITIGGSNTTDFLESCDWEYRGVAIYDLNSGNWGSVFHVDADEYKVPANITGTIGGGPLGNATMKAPKNGFDNPQLEHIITQSRLSNATNTIEHHHGLRGGYIAAIVICPFFGCIAAGLYYFVLHPYYNNPRRH